MNMKGVIV